MASVVLKYPRDLEVSFTDGVLDGEPIVLMLLGQEARFMAAAGKSLAISPEGPMRDPADYATDPWAFFALGQLGLVGVGAPDIVHSDMPALDLSLPDGAM
jgi:hypothetical protein